MKVSKGTIRCFDVDFAHCDCVGTRNRATDMQVIPIKWKRTDSDPNGRVRFQCMRCKQTWSMNNIRRKGSGIELDCSHSEEIARRMDIDPDYNELIAVNVGGAAQSPGSFPGVYSGRASCIRPGAQ